MDFFDSIIALVAHRDLVDVTTEDIRSLETRNFVKFELNGMLLEKHGGGLM